MDSRRMAVARCACVYQPAPPAPGASQHSTPPTKSISRPSGFVAIGRTGHPPPPATEADPHHAADTRKLRATIKYEACRPLA